MSDDEEETSCNRFEENRSKYKAYYETKRAFCERECELQSDMYQRVLVYYEKINDLKAS